MSLTMEVEDGNGGAERGALIVIEGLDRAGKSTQCARLIQALQDGGQEVKGIRFPGERCKVPWIIGDQTRLTIPRQGNSNWEDNRHISSWERASGRPCHPLAFLGESLGSSCQDTGPRSERYNSGC